MVQPESYRVTTDTEEVDFDAACDLIHTYSYWAARPIELTRRGFESPSSIVFGALDSSGATVGCARVVTDYSTFGWVCDVIVHPDHRGRGIGKMLMKAVVEHPVLAPMRLILVTRDAHGLYEQFGFERKEMMRRPAPESPPTGCV
jgi:GNAT superfamily N-acetyltransferase